MVHADWRWLYGGITLAVVLLGGCRKEHQRPTDALSGEQRKLSSVISAKQDSAPATLTLSRELGNIIAEEPAGDSSGTLLAAFNEKLDSAVLLLSSKLFMETDSRRIISAISDIIFTTWGITFSENRDDLRYLYPHLVLAEKKGSCVGMSLLYLLIAEKAELPLYGVRAPGHMFVRFDNGRERCNIETLRGGEVMDNAWYRQRWAIKDTLLYPLDNLPVSGVLALVKYNLGTVFMNTGNYARAKTSFEQATRMLSDFAEAQGNLALTLEALGDSTGALEMLSALHERHPTLEHIDKNLASLELKCGRYADALTTYTELSFRNPQDPAVHYGRAFALFQQNRPGDCRDALSKTLALDPRHTGALKLMRELEN